MNVLLDMRNRKNERKINQNYYLFSSFHRKIIFRYQVCLHWEGVTLQFPELSSFVTLLSLTYYALQGFSVAHKPGALETMALETCSRGRLSNQFSTFQVVLFGSIHINFSLFYVKKASRQYRGRESNKTSDYTSITFIAARAGSRTEMIDKAMVLFNN